jgi:sugar phosphate isomerase/epimerase
MKSLGIMQGRLCPTNLKKLNIFPKKWESEFYEIEKIGFKYIELLYDRKQSKFNPLLKKSRNFKNFLKHSKNKKYSINLDFFTKNYMFNKVKKNKKILKEIINIANELKIKIIVIPCIEENFMTNENLIKFIKILKKMIYNKFPSISLEIKIFNKKVLKEINNKVGICYDTGNVATESKNYLKDLENNLKKINHIHIKDKIKKNSFFFNCRLGKGVVQFKKIFRILKKKNYQGSLTLETSIGQDPLKEAKKNLNYVKKFIQ